MSKCLMILAGLATVVLADCKPTPSRDQERADSSAVVGQAPSSNASSSSTGSENATALVKGSPTDASGGADTSVGSAAFQCAPKVFSRRDTITLRMKTPHGEYLAVNQPNGTIFYLIYPHPEPSDPVLESSEAFVEIPTIRFRADLKARPRVYGRDTLEAVFREPGEYVLRIGHKLESERASEIHKCTVRLVPGNSP